MSDISGKRYFKDDFGNEALEVWIQKKLVNKWLIFRFIFEIVFVLYERTSDQPQVFIFFCSLDNIRRR